MNIKFDGQQKNQLRNFCERWKIKQLDLFGPVLKEFTNPDERINVLLTFTENTSHTLGDRMNMELGLQKLFNMNRQVDIYSPAGISHNVMPYHPQNYHNEDSFCIFPFAGESLEEAAETAIVTPTNNQDSI